MSKHDESKPAEQATRATAQAAPETAQDRPDRRPPRGNPPIEQTDVERGRGKLERISGN